MFPQIQPSQLLAPCDSSVLGERDRQTDRQTEADRQRETQRAEGREAEGETDEAKERQL